MAMTATIDSLEQLLATAAENGFTPEIEQAFMDGLPGVFARVRVLEGVLTQCRDQFQFYANEHLAAGKTEKATTNQRFADLARAALTLKETDCVG